MEKISGAPGLGRSTNSMPLSRRALHVRTALAGAQKHLASAKREDQPFGVKYSPVFSLRSTH